MKKFPALWVVEFKKHKEHHKCLEVWVPIDVNYTREGGRNSLRFDKNSANSGEKYRLVKYVRLGGGSNEIY